MAGPVYQVCKSGKVQAVEIADECLIKAQKDFTMLKQQVLNTIDKNALINYGDGIVVGISGGYDSVCLLHILYSLSSELGLKLFPVHINHMLRGDEAARDENLVRDFCHSLGLEAYIKHIDIAKKARNDKISLEEAGRNARYEEFNRVAESVGAGKIAVAHSRNDQAETVLMRIIRGTGLEGLRGMEYKRDNIIRPLLDADREQIERYVDENGLKAIVDSSNLHTDFFRNRIRLNVIPAINSAAGSDITDNLLRLSKIVVADDDFLRYNSELYYQKSRISQKDFYVELNLDELNKMPRAMKNRVVRMAVAEACGSVTGLQFLHVEKLLQLCECGRTGASIDIPLGLKAVKSYGSLIIQKQQEEEFRDFEQELEIPGKNEIASINGIISANILNFDTNGQCREFIKEKRDAYTKFIDFEELALKEDFRLVVRNRRNGDIFKPLNSNGSKKLKEYFIDNKIPKKERDRFPLIAINKEIIWIIGNKTSDKYKVTDNTKSVLMITFSYTI